MHDENQVAVICGGQSVEHSISIVSSRFVVGQLIDAGYAVSLLYIDEHGRWSYLVDIVEFLGGIDPLNCKECVAVAPLFGEESAFLIAQVSGERFQVNILFPMIHGTQGEDGCIQGVCRLWNRPFVGADILACALSMDKVLTKSVLHAAGVPVAPWQSVTADSLSDFNLSACVDTLGLPLFVKPANLGSSVGITKVMEADDLAKAIDEALSYDPKVLIEAGIEGREIETAVMGNTKPAVAVPGELIVHHEFYSYAAKYEDPEGAVAVVPADLTAEEIAALQSMAVTVYRLLGLEGLARVDFFLAPGGAICVNEVNTLPGMTPISLYPKMWANSGLTAPLMLNRLIELGVSRYNNAKALNRHYTTDQTTVGDLND